MSKHTTEPVAWQERQAYRINKATREVIEWTRWHECEPRRLSDPLAFTDPDDMIPREWRPLYAAPTAPSEDALRDVLTAVFREIEAEDDDGDGNAPGHGHAIPGIWDSDNGELAGKPCAWCALWNKAKGMLSTPKDARHDG